VARDFEHLFSVLAEVEAGLVHRKGGDRALAAALGSEDLATLHFAEQRFVSGTLRGVAGNAAGGLLSFQGRWGAGEQGRLSQVFAAGAGRYHLPFGPLADRAQLTSLGPLGQRVQLRFASGALLEGELASTSPDDRGRVLWARFLDYRLEFERAGVIERGREYLLFVAPALLTAHAGALDPSFHPASEPPGRRVPKPRELAARERALLALYERAIEVFRNQAGSAALSAFQAIHAQLAARFPNEWLLRWNLLECLCKSGESGPFAQELQRELLTLELKFGEREPIASGLRYLATVAA